MPDESLELCEEPYDGPTAQSLIAQVQQEYVVRYGGPDEAPVHPAEFAPPRGRFLVGYVGTTPVATGGFRGHDDGSVELKRMFVVPAYRGRGYSRVVLAALEDLAFSLGFTRILLETGSKQPEAMRLYETSGYSRITGFGHYACVEGSVSYAKTLSADAPAR